MQSDPLWNQFPVWTDETDTISSLDIRLKTFLFHKAYLGVTMDQGHVIQLSVMLLWAQTGGLPSPGIYRPLLRVIKLYPSVPLSPNQSQQMAAPV